MRAVFGARAQCDRVRRRLCGIAQQVQRELQHAVRIAAERRQARVVVAVEMQHRIGVGRHQRACAFGDFMQIDAAQVRFAAGPQEAVGEIGEPVRLGDDHRGQTLQIGIGDASLQKLRGAAQTRRADF